MKKLYKKIIAVIPARGGSKGIPRKNVVKLRGKPLIYYTIEAARESGVFDRIIVSTEDKEIAEISKSAGAEVMIRPKRLSKDTTSTEPVISYVLKLLLEKERYRPYAIILLQPTSPLRSKDNIKAAYKKFMVEKLDSMLSVTRNTDFIWRRSNKKFAPINYDYLKRPRRQEMEAQFRENGAIYIAKYSAFMKFKNRLGGKIGYYEMGEERSVDIDTHADLMTAGNILKRLEKSYKESD